MTKPLLLGCAILGLAALAPAQEPSAKDLRTLLHADVKSYANDGRLVATWSLRKEPELHGFKLGGPSRVRIVPGEGIELESHPDGHGALMFKELEFLPPCTIGFEIRLDGPLVGFTAVFSDPANPGSALVAGVHVGQTPDGRDRFDLVRRMVDGKPAGLLASMRSSARALLWTPVAITLKDKRATISVAKARPEPLEGIPLARFTPAFFSMNGKARLRNLSVDSQVDRDSMRKLFRSMQSRATSRPKAVGSVLAAATAWGKIDEERSGIELGPAASAAIDALPGDPRARIDAGLDWIKNDDPKRALECFEAAASGAPKSGVVLWLTGMAACDCDQRGKGLQYLERAVAADPKLAAAWLALGEAHAEAGEDAKAIEAFAEAETLDATDPWVHAARAHLHLERARLADARKDVEHALGKRPESAGLRLLARSLERLSARPAWKDAFKKENAWYVVETSISSKLAADLAQKLVVYRRHLEKAFPLPVKPDAPPSRVWVFDSEEEYHAFAGSLAGGHEHTVGLYYPLLKTLLLTSKVSAATTQHVLFHEAFHQYFDLALERPPIWLNEGLAEYFGATTFDVSGRPTEGGVVQNRLPELRGALVPLRDLMSMRPGAFMSPRRVGLHYAESWALVHFLKAGGNPVYARLFDHYCTALIAGKQQAEALSSAFDKAGGPTLDDVEKDFRAYVRRLAGGR